MVSKEWLDSLKPGDEVVVMGSGDPYITTVQKVGKLHITCSTGNGYTGSKYRVKDGRRMDGGKWFRPHIEPLTEEMRSIIQTRTQRSVLKYLDWNDVAPEVVARVYALVKGEKDGEAAA